MKRVQLLVKAAGVAALLAGMAGCGLASSASVHQSTAEDMLPAKAASAQNAAATDGAFANFENAGDRVMCLDADSNHYPSNGDNVQLWACNTHPEQEWRITSAGQLQNTNTSMCLDADSNHYPSNGDNVQLWACNTHPEQEWRITSAGQLQNTNTSMCLDADSNHYPSNGDNVQLWACNTHPEQEWVLGSVASAAASTAYGQRGVQDNPANTYCNKYSAYWGDGSKCSNGLRSDEWCADFAAWAWRQAGFSFTWGSATGDINGSAKSFYYWAVAHNTWHTAGSGYKPQPGDVAVYGSSGPSASHVGVVYSNGSSGPNVVNGDWETKYPSQFPTAVYYQTNESSEAGGKLVGYASP
jgi:hypothetical protein